MMDQQLIKKKYIRIKRFCLSNIEKWKHIANSFQIPRDPERYKF